MSPLSKIQVFYCPEMTATTVSLSPSAHKPSAVVTSWQETNLAIEVIRPEPATVEQILLAHDAAYVHGVLDLTKKNGFGNHDKAVAESLKWTSGAMLSAARMALQNGVGAVAPCSGFHHACFERGGGFCTFNGLVIAGAVLCSEKRIKRYGILDFDQHIGDGTSDILWKLNWLDDVVHYTPAHEYNKAELAESFLAAIPKIAEAFRDCELVIYQAGVDPHVNDPLGGWLTTEQIFERDQRVFQEFRKLKIPVAWTLAGGYQKDEQDSIAPVLRLHDNTLQACAEAWLPPF